MSADDPIDKYVPRQEGMTREQFKEHVKACAEAKLSELYYAYRDALIAHDALQRETITRLEWQRDELNKCCQQHEKIEAELLTKAMELQARLTASEAAKTWTRDRPTIAGWYWFKRNPIATPELTQFELESDGVTLYSKGIRAWAKRWDGLFQGPLTPGEE